VSSLERLGEAGWLPDVRSEESLLYQACNQPAGLRLIRICDRILTFILRSDRDFACSRRVSPAARAPVAHGPRPHRAWRGACDGNPSRIRRMVMNENVVAWI
jgi:hypothetical protein